MGLVAPPAPAFSFVETPGSPPAQVWYRCGRCCGFKSTSQSPVTIKQSQSRAVVCGPWGWSRPRPLRSPSSKRRGVLPPKFGARCGLRVRVDTAITYHVSPSCNHHQERLVRGPWGWSRPRPLRSASSKRRGVLPPQFGTGVADVAGVSRHRNHLSQPINHNHHQERLVRGREIGLGSSYEACGSKDRELGLAVHRLPSTVHRLCIQWAACRSLPPTGRPTARRSIGRELVRPSCVGRSFP